MREFFILLVSRVEQYRIYGINGKAEILIGCASYEESHFAHSAQSVDRACQQVKNRLTDCSWFVGIPSCHQRRKEEGRNEGRGIIYFRMD